MRVRFSDIFRQNPDGTLEPLRPIQIGGVGMGPGVKFTNGVKFGGVNLFDYFGHDFEATDEGGILKLTDIYKESSRLAAQS